MTLEQIEDFEMWKKAEAFCDEVNAIQARPSFGRNVRLREQLEEATDSILANMSEGFEQPTDRGFARYLYTSKGSTAETYTRLRRAWQRGHLTQSEIRRFQDHAAEVSRLTTGLIKQLMKTPNRRRGLG